MTREDRRNRVVFGAIFLICLDIIILIRKITGVDIFQNKTISTVLICVCALISSVFANLFVGEENEDEGIDEETAEERDRVLLFACMAISGGALFFMFKMLL